MAEMKQSMEQKSLSLLSYRLIKENDMAVIPRTIIVNLKPDWFETVGSYSLLGLIHDQEDYTPTSGDILILEFGQTSIDWRKVNGGPSLSLVPEFSIPLFLSDILCLRDRGIEIEITTRHWEPQE